MVTNKLQVKYLQFLIVAEMYEESKKWLSELSFIKDEHLFFDDIIKTYTLDLINKKHFTENKEIITSLAESQKRNDSLMESVKVHKNNIEILLDGIDQIKEEADYKKQHKELIIVVSDFYKDYKNLKTELFKIVKKIIKSKKRRLLENL